MTWNQCSMCIHNQHRTNPGVVVCELDVLDPEFSFPFHNEECKGFEQIEAISVEEDGKITIAKPSRFYNSAMLARGMHQIQLRDLYENCIDYDELVALVSFPKPEDQWGYTRYSTYMTIDQLADMRDYIQEIIN